MHGSVDAAARSLGARLKLRHLCGCCALHALPASSQRCGICVAAVPRHAYTAAVAAVRRLCHDGRCCYCALHALPGKGSLLLGARIWKVLLERRAGESSLSVPLDASSEEGLQV
jgi:hypothetical protein